MIKKKALILDLDGTLYNQQGVQFIMGCFLVIYYFFHPWKKKELKILIKFRKNRERNTKNIVNNQYIVLAKEYKKSVQEIEMIIDKWIMKKPLKVIYYLRDKNLLKLIKYLKRKGIKIIIYSDYPTMNKLKSLKISYDQAYDSTHPEIRVLKPDPKGLQYILKVNKLKNEEVLFVGDRDSKDGECARKCQISYIILPKYFRKKSIIEIKKNIGVK